MALRLTWDDDDTEQKFGKTRSSKYVAPLLLTHQGCGCIGEGAVEAVHRRPGWSTAHETPCEECRGIPRALPTIECDPADTGRSVSIPTLDPTAGLIEIPPVPVVRQ